MKKLLLLIAALGVLVGTVSCGDDEPKRGNGVFTVNPAMINHMVNMNNGEVVGVTSTHNKLTFDTVKHVASLELHYFVGNTEKTRKLEGITATPKRLGFYTLDWLGDLSFSGYVDLNQGSYRFSYWTEEGIIVTSTMPEIFFLNTESTITYDDATASNKSEITMYQFTINPESQSATVCISDILHAKDNKNFVSITSYGVPYTVTPQGFAFAAENLKTEAKYIGQFDGATPTIKTTDKYPFKTFNATINLSSYQLEDRLDANYMIGGSATVTATGKTY